MLHTSTLNGAFNGIKVDRHAPEVSHLLFADDFLNFCKANLAQVNTIIDILRLFERVSGEKINFSGMLLFSHLL